MCANDGYHSPAGPAIHSSSGESQYAYVAPLTPPDTMRMGAVTTTGPPGTKCEPTSTTMVSPRTASATATRRSS